MASGYMTEKGKRVNRQLPNRSSLKDLAGGAKTINDYGKRTPLSVATPTPAGVQNLRSKLRGR